MDLLVWPVLPPRFSCPETFGNGNPRGSAWRLASKCECFGAIKVATLAYAGTGAAAGRAFKNSSAKRALRLRPAEITSTPMPM